MQHRHPAALQVGETSSGQAQRVCQSIGQTGVIGRELTMNAISKGAAVIASRDLAPRQLFAVDKTLKRMAVIA